MNWHRQSFLIGCAVGVGAVSGCLALAHGLRSYQQSKAAAEPKEAQRAPTHAVVSIAGAPAIGSASAPLTLVEFSDFQCPYCKQFHDVIFPQLKRDYIAKGLVRFVHKDLPLPFHSQAMPAAIGARCAADQTSYWHFYETLFARQSCLECQGLTGLARQAGLKQPAFSSCLVSGRHRQTVMADVREAQALAINGTPSFVLGPTRSPSGQASPGTQISGTVMMGALPWPEFRRVIQAALGQKQHHP